MSKIILQDVAFVLFGNDIKQLSNYGEQYVVIPLTCKVKVSHPIQYKSNSVIQHVSSELRLPMLTYSWDMRLNTAGSRRLVTLTKLEV